MTEEIRARAQRRDRWVSLIVIGIFVVALILGWVVKSAAENRTVLYDEGGIRVNYPEGWVKGKAEAPVLLQVEDKWAAPARTALTLQRRNLKTGVGQPLGDVVSTLGLERAKWASYRAMNVEASTPESPIFIGGREAAMHVTFAYVEAKPNPFQETVPAVMRGDDYLFPAGNEVYIVTLTAAEANYARAQGYLQTFVRTLQVPTK